MDSQQLIELVVHTTALFVLLIVAVTVIRIGFGGAMLFAELGIALLVALVYFKIAERLGYTPQF